MWAKHLNFTINGHRFDFLYPQINGGKVWSLMTKLLYFYGIIIKLDFDGNIIDTIYLPMPFGATSEVSFFYKPSSL